MTELSPLDPVAEILRRRIGLSPVSIGLTSINHAVGRRMRALGLSQRRAYVRLLKGNSEEADELIEEVVVGETWFFRDRAAFQALASKAARGDLPAGWRQSIKVLSMPCSSGEEPYSTAMALLEAGLRPNRIRVTAMDVSKRALEAARVGLYGPRSFREDDLSFRDRHFSARQGQWRIGDHLRELVQFMPGNLLLPPPVIAAQRYDAIFMRNLLIYLTPDYQEKAIALLRRLLKPGGLAFVGLAEAGILLRAGMVRQAIKGAAAFTIGADQKAEPLKPNHNGLKSLPKIKNKTGSDLKSSKLKRPLAVPPGKPVPGSRPKQVTEQSVRPPLDRARDLADQGQLVRAVEICEDLIKTGSASAEVFLLRGMIAEATGQAEGAREWFRKALYLNPFQTEAIYHLALQEERSGNYSRAKALRDRLARLDQGPEAAHG